MVMCPKMEGVAAGSVARQLSWRRQQDWSMDPRRGGIPMLTMTWIRGGRCSGGQGFRFEFTKLEMPPRWPRGKCG